VPRHLFVFGYETPSQQRNNRAKGWDDEDSVALWITADSEPAALEWGRRVATDFVRQLYAWEGSESAYDWNDASFAHWIEAHPGERFSPDDLDLLQQVQAGEHPDFRAWRP